MLYLEVSYSGGLIFTDQKDAIAFADAASRAISVTSEGYGGDQKFTPSDEGLLRTITAIKPSQLVSAPLPAAEVVASPAAVAAVV